MSCRSRAIKTSASQGSLPLTRPVGQEPMRSAAIEQSYKVKAVFVVMGVKRRSCWPPCTASKLSSMSSTISWGQFGSRRSRGRPLPFPSQQSSPIGEVLNTAQCRQQSQISSGMQLVVRKLEGRIEPQSPGVIASSYPAALLDSPEDVPVLGPMIERELLYRLLQGPQGQLLRQIAQPDGALDRVRPAVTWIRDHPDTHLRIDALCDASGMSRASLHCRFLSITGFSPLQYQKHLRLQEARQLLLAGGHSAAEAAFSVGYESASQFSREYLRQFGAPPARHVQQMRQAIGQPKVTLTSRHISQL